MQQEAFTGATPAANDGASPTPDPVRIVLNEAAAWQPAALRCLHFASGATPDPRISAPTPAPGLRAIEVTHLHVDSADNLATALAEARRALAGATPPDALLVDVRPAPSPASLAPLLALPLPVLLLVEADELDPAAWAGAAALLLRSEITPYWLYQSVIAAVRQAEHGRLLHTDTPPRSGWNAEAVTLSREQFNGWLQASSVFLSRMDTELRTVWSENAHPDWPPERTLGRRPEEYLSPGAAAAQVQLLQQALASGQVVRGAYENEVQGRPQRIELLVEPLFDAQGATIGLALLGSEITDSRLLQESLRMSDEAMREVLQQSGHSLARVDANRRYVWFNNGELTTSPTPILGRALGTLPPGLESPRYVEMVEYAINTGTRAQLEYTVEDPSLDRDKRRYYDIHIKAILDPGGKVDGALIFAMEVTRYRRLTETLTERVEQLRSASQLARLTMLLLAPDSTCKWVSAWGDDQTFAALAGRKVLEVGPPAMREELRTLLQRAQESAAPVSSSFALGAAQDGSPQRWFEVNVMPQWGEDGALREYHMAITEVTQARQTEQRLQVANETIQLVLAQAPLMIAQVDQNLNYVWAESGEGWQGVRPTAGMQMAHTLGPREREMLYGWARDVMATGKPRQGKVSFTLPVGQLVFSLYMQPAYDAAGRSAGIYVLSLDTTSHEQMTAALQQSERRYRRLIEATTASVWQMNADCSAFLEPSPTWHIFTGSETTETLDDLLHAFHSADQPRVRAAIADAVARGERLEMDARLWHLKSGAWRWVELRLVPLHTAHGEVVEWVGAALDVDAREQARQGAREREEDLETLLDILPAIVFIAQDAEAAHIVGNEAGRRILRQSNRAAELSMTAAEELRPSHFRVLIDGKEAQPDDLPVQYAARTGKEWIGAEDIVFDDGAVVSLLGRSRPLFDAAGAVRGAVAAFVDVTEMRATSLALMRSEQRQRLAAEVAGIGLWEWDGGHSAIWNKTQCEFFGIECEGVERTLDPWAVVAFVEDADPEQMIAGFAQVFAAEREWSGEYRVRPPGGAPRVLHMSGRVMHAPDGRGVRMVGVTIDITEAREIERVREQATAELEQRVQERTQDLVKTYSQLSEETAQRMLAEANLLEIRRLLGRSQDLERVRLAHELHDGPMQELAALAVELTLLSGRVPAESAKTVLELRSRVRDVAVNLRSFAGDLRPPVLDSFGICAAIQAHVEQRQERHPQLSIQLELPAEDYLLEESLQTSIYRVFQQALYNVYQHAEAGEVRVRVSSDESELTLVVQDNGIGFQVPDTWMELARSGHLGIVGMTERAAGVGGTVRIASAPGQGTRVEARFPLRLA